uniref:Uncharacterized protein doxF n=1 Tax=Acidianus ambivalens TaxID=2283 RepID=P94120_ACIAM|nr:putative small hydrophobic subunit of the terminal oxidase with unknown homologue [Acidianus ambivalens]
MLTLHGSFIFPFSGPKNGESVSVNNLSRGTSFAICLLRLSLTIIGGKDKYPPRSRIFLAIFILPSNA